MKLVFLYGPPGVGKLTVAKELARITGYKILHNHLTLDLVNAVFDFGTTEFMDLVGRYRLDMMEQAAKNHIKGLIFTMVYAQKFDDWYIKKMIKLLKKYQGQIYFIQLICEQAELYKRIKLPSRKNYRKINKIKTLKAAVKKHELFKAVPFKPNLSIDNTRLSARKTALKIKHYFGI